jgi:hypothetical protein
MPQHDARQSRRRHVSFFNTCHEQDRSGMRPSESLVVAVANKNVSASPGCKSWLLPFKRNVSRLKELHDDASTVSIEGGETCSCYETELLRRPRLRLPTPPGLAVVCVDSCCRVHGPPEQATAARSAGSEGYCCTESNLAVCCSTASLPLAPDLCASWQGCCCNEQCLQA